MEQQQKRYVQTKELVGKEFHVSDVKDRQYRMWDSQQNKYALSQTPKKGFAPVFNIETDKGIWTASAGQYSQLLLACEKQGISDILDKDFTCNSNGQTGMDIRYFFNLIIDKNFNE